MTPNSAPVLAGIDLNHGYGKGTDRVDVLHDVSIELAAGDRIGLAGRSGTGKSTLARILALVEKPQSGQVLIDGEPVSGAGLDLPPGLRRRVQLLWQAPRPAVNPRQRLERIILEPLLCHDELPGSRTEQADLTREAASRVGLTPDLLTRRPNEVSDGQLQRACVARALLLQPDVLIADEPGAMLDVSTQALLLESIAEEQARGMAVLLISHDRTLLDHWCDRVLTMDAGMVHSAG